MHQTILVRPNPLDFERVQQQSDLFASATFRFQAHGSGLWLVSEQQIRMEGWMGMDGGRVCEVTKVGLKDEWSSHMLLWVLQIIAAFLFFKSPMLNESAPKVVYQPHGREPLTTCKHSERAKNPNRSAFSNPMPTQKAKSRGSENQIGFLACFETLNPWGAQKPLAVFWVCEKVGTNVGTRVLGISFFRTYQNRVNLPLEA